MLSTNSSVFHKGLMLSVRSISISFFCFFWLLTNSCTESSTEPNKVIPDTTNHDFTWVIDTLGTPTFPSQLNDVLYFDSNNIWVVGELHTDDTDRFDSTGTWIPPFNLIRWDGMQWNLERILNTLGNIMVPLEGIWSENDKVWVSIGRIYEVDTNLIAHRSFDSNPSAGIVVLKLWGKDPEIIYGVGPSGTTVERNKGQWETIPRVTDLALVDVWGSPNNEVVWACGFDDLFGSVLLRKTTSEFEKVVEITSPNIPHPPNQITRPILSLWTDSSDSVYLAAPGRVYVAPQNSSGEARENIWWDYTQGSLPPRIYSIRGNAGNDYFIAGFNQYVGHYNGRNWKEYAEIAGEGQWQKIATQNNQICIVGKFNSLVIIARGNRHAQ